jgi:hypothetical protein
MNTHNENWKNQNENSNDFKHDNSFSINSANENGYAVDPDDDVADTDEVDNDDDLLADDDDELETDDDELDDDDDLTDLNETPEVEESENEGTGYQGQREVDQPQRDADTSISEQIDVTPPNQHEFPKTGPARTDFESRPFGRTTGRMVGHEPGTEGI